MDGQLKIIEGPDTGNVISFAEGQTVLLGRGANTASKLSDRYTSRVHCQLEVRNGVLTVTDLGGSNGTSVNGAIIQTPRIVLPGDIIGLGYTRLRVQCGNDAGDQTVSLPARVTAVAGPTLETLPIDAGALTGEVLADYRVGPMLGKGETGVVYNAHNAASGQTVALKVFHTSFVGNADAKQRFLRSSRTVMNLRHPHLISIYQAGETGPFCWLAMELFEAETLAKVIQRVGIANILDWRYGLRIAVHVTRGLEFAQKHGIVHRNITPSNILYRASDKFAKLGDLMLAKALTADADAAITRRGELLGDVVYMSPERAFGQTDIDGRSDLYELGATVYALLTGRPPCAGKTPMEIIESFQKSEPIRPKQVQLSIPDAFEAIVLRMLAKKPEDRFQTPAELLTALEQVAKMEGVVT